MMENPGGANSTSNPLANQAAPEGHGGNPLSRIAPQLGGQQRPMPSPTRAQTTAAVQRFSAIQRVLKPILDDPKLGKENVRPAVLNAGSLLLGTKLISLPELMQVLNKFPADTDPLEQKQFLQNVYDSAKQSESQVLDSHGAAVVAGKLPPDGGDQYDAGNHEQLMDSLLSHYKR